MVMDTALNHAHEKKVVKKTTHDDIEADLLGLYENYIWTIIIH